MYDRTLYADIFYMKDFTGVASAFNKPMLLSTYRTPSSATYLQPVQIVVEVSKFYSLLLSVERYI